MKYIHYVSFSISTSRGTLYVDFFSDNQIPTFTELKQNINYMLCKFDKFEEGYSFGIDNISTVLNE